MLPGMSGKDIDVDDNAMKKPEAIIRSMTPKERRDPSILNASRRKRIAAGSGRSVQAVNQLIKQWGEMNKMMGKMRQMANGMQSGGKQSRKARRQMSQMMRNMGNTGGNMGGFPF